MSSIDRMEIHHEIEPVIREMLNLADNQDIPAKVAEAYNCIKWSYDRIGGGGKHLPPQMLGMAVGVGMMLERANNHTLPTLGAALGEAAETVSSQEPEEDAEEDPAEEEVEDPATTSISSDEGPTINWGEVAKGEDVIGLFKGQQFTGEFLSVAGGQDKGKLRVKIDDDPARFREVPSKDVALV